MIIVMENHGYHDIIGSSSAPFLNSLAQSYVSATAWSDVSHPSLPNYLALTAGSIFTNPSDCIQAGSNPTGDCVFNTSAINLADQLTGAGISWKAYIEDMPRACDTSDNFGPNNYDVNHNPFMYYDNVLTNQAECNSDVPYTQLATDIANNALPSFIWVTPNLIHDMHDGTIADGDNFLKAFVPQIQATSWYAQDGVILITWDEGETEEQIPLLAVSAKNAGKGAFAGQGNHYGVLRGIEEEYGLALIGNAANAANGDIKALLP
jgi:phospholipase C